MPKKNKDSYFTPHVEAAIQIWMETTKPPQSAVNAIRRKFREVLMTADAILADAARLKATPQKSAPQREVEERHELPEGIKIVYTNGTTETYEGIHTVSVRHNSFLELWEDMEGCSDRRLVLLRDEDSIEMILVDDYSEGLPVVECYLRDIGYKGPLDFAILRA